MKPCQSTLRRALNVLGCSTAAGGILLSTLTPAIAATQPALEEVIVTAQKREESLQKTPISLVSLGSQELENLRISGVGDLGSNVPNLQSTNQVNSAGTPRIFIRGIGNFDTQITEDPSVAVYIDGVYVARNEGMGIDVAEIQRIEVLRGPQGTLYGRNSTGGAINFVTRPPEIGEWHFRETLTAGKWRHLRSKTMLNAPIGNTAAARLSYVSEDKQGFVRNVGTGKDRFGDKNRNGLRLDFLWQPTTDLSIRYAYDHSKIKDTPAYIAPAPLGTFIHRPSRSASPAVNLKANNVSADGHEVIITWDIDSRTTFKSITAYRDIDSYAYQNFFGNTLTTDGYVGQSQWSQEFQLVGDAFDNTLQYVTGLYYFTENGNSLVVTDIPAFFTTTVAKAPIDNVAYAAYAQGTWTPDLLDRRLHVTVGARWSKDKRDARLKRGVMSPSGVVTIFGTGSGNKDFDDLSPAFVVSYDFTDTINAYVKAVKGYKAGGFNTRASSIAHFEEGFDEEKLWSYELGVKSQWWNNRLRINGAVFQADYDDIQIDTQSDLSDPSVSDILNAGRATIKGAELDITALVLPSLQVSLRYGYLDASYDRITNALGQDVTDNYLFVNAPENSYAVNADYDIGRLPFGKLTANVNYTWQDHKYISTSTVSGRLKVRNYGLLGARLTLGDLLALQRGQLSVSLWGKNLLDKEYAVLHAPLFGGFYAFGDPRSWGVDLTYEF